MRERIVNKINGVPEYYDRQRTWQLFLGPGWNGQIVYGAGDGLEALHNDLLKENFQDVLAGSERLPLDMVSYLDLSAYHYAHIAGISAEHLEEQGKTDEWRWMFALHILYERMQLSTAQIRAAFKEKYTTLGRDPLIDSVNASLLFLAELRKTVRDLQSHFFNYPGLPGS